MKTIQLAAVLVSTALANVAMAQGKYEWKTAVAAGYPYKYVTNDPMASRFYTLKNGLSVILSPTKKDPRMQVYIAVKAGSKTDPADHTGLAHYLEHMMFKGTSKYGSLNWAKEKPELDKIDVLYEEYNHTTEEAKRKAIYHRIDSISGVASTFAIANEYDKMMASMGAQGTNAFTSVEETVYTEDIPANAVDKFLKVQADRFSDAQFRIFHTELEAVYEEKNRSLDNDAWKVEELMNANLFLNHNYGKQTTIGTIEHLKNPSMLEIKKYYHTYYVPNNMGIIISGDFDPDVMIKKVDANFAMLKNKPVPKYVFSPEVPIAAPVVKEVFGPDAESISIGYRIPGIHSKDALLADLVGQILTNGRAGLLDLNLVKKQKLLRASASAEVMVDYGSITMRGVPTLGQNLEEVKTLMLGEIDNLKKGNFDDALITSVINNQKKFLMRATESYSARARQLMNAFTNEEDWRDDVAYIDMLSKLTKKDIINYANKYFGENYVAIYKRKGEDKNVVKVEKPAITAVETNRDSQSPFVKEVVAMPVTSIQPVWVDYTKDLKKGKAGAAEILYVQNKENGLFRMSYRYNVGTWNDKKLGIATQYLQFLGTDKLSAEDISKSFYQLACSFNISAGTEFTTVSIEGLQENFDKAVSLFENLMANCKADDKALASLKARLSKTRSDAKSSKAIIMQGLVSYARFGANSPFNNVLSDYELKGLTGAELVDLLHGLSNTTHRIIYYGPVAMEAFTTSIQTLHKMPSSFITPTPAKAFTYTAQADNQVLFADYDMVQAEIQWVRNIPGYDPLKQPTLEMFNNYFGGGMGSLVFQTIRESKALAYSTYSFTRTPEKKDDPYYVAAYVGCQADKFDESIKAMNELLNDLPSVENNLVASKSSLKKDIETQRVTQDGIIFDYLASERKGLNSDIRKAIYENADKMTYADLKKFHDENMVNKPYTYCVVASEKKVTPAQMGKYGTLKKLTLAEIFGY